MVQMKLKKKIFFIPDLDNKSGLGHYYRCLKFSEFFRKKYKIFILLKKNLKNTNILLNAKNNNIIFFDDLKLTIKKFSNEGNFFFIDSYNSKKINLVNKLTKNSISTADKLVSLNTKYLIDHTFLRNKKDHKKKNPKSIIYSNHLYFPFTSKKIKKKKKYIMINFGTYNSSKEILSVIDFIKRVKLDLKYKILIINKKFRLNLLKNYNLKNINLISHTSKLDKYYSETIFCFGACGISLYERSFYGIPSACKPIAKNQIYNYQNFLRKKTIIDLNSMISDNEFTLIKFKNICKKTKKKLKIYFSSKEQKKEINKLIEDIK